MLEHKAGRRESVRSQQVESNLDFGLILMRERRASDNRLVNSNCVCAKKCMRAIKVWLAPRSNIPSHHFKLNQYSRLDRRPYRAASRASLPRKRNSQP